MVRYDRDIYIVPVYTLCTIVELYNYTYSYRYSITIPKVYDHCTRIAFYSGTYGTVPGITR